MNTNILLLLVVIMYLQTYNWFAQAQKPFLEPFFITDSISVNEWIEQKYGEDVQFYESARIKRRNNVVENTIVFNRKICIMYIEYQEEKIQELCQEVELLKK